VSTQKKYLPYSTLNTSGVRIRGWQQGERFYCSDCPVTFKQDGKVFEKGSQLGWIDSFPDRKSRLAFPPGGV